MVNVTKENFIEQTNDLLQHLPTAAFIAIDEEMTGITVPGTPRPAKEQPPSALYASTLKYVPERYSIIQLGVVLFHATSEPGEVHEWQARRYNFYVFPAQDGWSGETREVVLNPGAVAFLQQHNMSLDLWTQQGVTYQTNDKAYETVQAYVEKELIRERAAEDKERHAKLQDSTRRRVELRRSEDIDFHARAMASLREWLDAALNEVEGPPIELAPEGAAFLLPSCNSFLRRALYESIEAEYPDLVLESAGNNQIRVLRLTEEESQTRKQRLRREDWEKVVVNKIGMWRVFEAISRVCRGEHLDLTSAVLAPSVDAVDFTSPLVPFAEDTLSSGSKSSRRRNIPLVVHNGFMDICFLLTHFHHETLPDTLKECKGLISRYFPIIYDTKAVTTEYSTWSNENSALAALFEKVVRQNNGLEDRIEVVADAGRGDATDDQEHEAAYDAYMTGAIYIGLCEQIKSTLQDETVALDGVGNMTHLTIDNEGTENTRLLYGRNKLFQMSMYTMDLEDPVSDPLSRGMLVESTFRVSDIDPSVSTRDIIRCLSGLIDTQDRRVNFEIIWLNDTSFLVAAVFRPEVSDTALDPAATILDHGKLILGALRLRFAKERIMSLEQVLKVDSLETIDEAKRDGWLSHFWRLLGFASSKRKGGHDQFDGQPVAKRRRV